MVHSKATSTDTNYKEYDLLKTSNLFGVFSLDIVVERAETKKIYQ